MKMLMQTFSVLLAAFFLTGAAKHVVELTDKSFRDEILKHDGVAIVEFYAPWCGHWYVPMVSLLLV